MTFVLGFDVGGTGARAAIARPGGPALARRSVAATARMGARGVDEEAVGGLLAGLARDLLAAAGADRAAAVAVGSTGTALLGEGLLERLPVVLGEAAGRGPILLSSDVLTSFAGALGLAGGAVIAAGTGAVAVGTDLRGTWRRADGWGHLLGDTGGGAWIGRRALAAAVRAEDGRADGSPVLLTALRERFGGARDLVADLYTRADRAGLLASFVPAVSDAARAGDAAAVRILGEAGTELAATALAALPPTAPGTVSATGNLFQAGPPLTDSFTLALAGAPRPVAYASPLGDSVDGALALASALLHDTLPPGTTDHVATVVRPPTPLPR
ncbi:N-acetylglucosamine kinase-like BadF-type ATPase [Actinocorallia herbida]|uniref:N-acetylglucosamine kinase-like BadF-type ATPase n=1 Tax=Actinocorallia herbida TaxID=58109 RepID=A0A3N1CUZ1_9ACTN|nr:BadF/BadG/BcrA/BcrD ATPase family protein [Actinocorallia herbida]ROO85129.1 N-acetylglucosamine kinase-like BadF-type ATPase [Actinocorallia herbida]